MKTLQHFYTNEYLTKGLLNGSDDFMSQLWNKDYDADWFFCIENSVYGNYYNDITVEFGLRCV